MIVKQWQLIYHIKNLIMLNTPEIFEQVINNLIKEYQDLGYLDEKFGKTFLTLNVYQCIWMNLKKSKESNIISI